MKLIPQQAPLYGDSIITVQLPEDVLEDDVTFYLVFTGSTVQHCTSTRKINPGTLETIAPGHDCCETVKVALCASKEGLPALVLGEESFQFIQDEAYDAAQFLATCAGNQQALNFTRFLDRSRLPSGDVDFLDEKVALAFRHLKLPAEWNVLGTDQTLNESSPRETLMHFAVRLGLLRLTWFLLQQPGGRGALCIHNNEGATPVSLALERGYQKLYQLLTEEEAGEPDSWSTLSHTVHSGDYCVKHHRGLNVYTLTTEAKEEAKASMEHDIEQLQKYIASHQHGNATEQPEPELSTSEDNCNTGTELKGYPAAAAPPSEEMPTEESTSALVNFDAKQLSAPTCHKESQCDSGNDTSDDLLSLTSTKNPGFSCERQNSAMLRKKEEEGPAAIVDSGTVSDKKDGRLSSNAVVNGAASLSCCGNTSEETGMTSTGVILNQASLCCRDNTQQEVRIIEEHTTQSTVAAAETAGKAPTPWEGVDVAMGQTECKNCTGMVDASSVQQHEENGGDETRGSKTTCLKEPPPVSGKLIHAVVPLLGDFGDTVCDGEECEGAQGIQAQDSVSTHVNSDAVPVGCGATSDSKRNGADSNSEISKMSLSKDLVQEEPIVKERQNVIANTEEELLVTQIKVSENALKQDPVGLEVNNNSKSGKLGVENVNGDIGLNELGLSDNMPNDSNAEMKNKPLDRPGPSDVESMSCPESSKTVALSVESEGDSQALKRMPQETETMDGGSIDSAEGGLGSAGNCHAENKAVLKGEEMCDSLKPDTASASKCESGPHLPLDKDLSSAEKVPLQNQLVISESISEQEGVDKQIKSFSSSLFKGNVQQEEAIGQERDAAVAPPGQVVSVHSNDPVFPSCAMGTECVQDNLMDTPSANHNKEPKQNQEVAAATAAERAVLAEQDNSVHGKVTAETSLPLDSEEKDGQSPSQTDEENKAESSQELRESGTLGKEKGLSEELAAVVKSSVCSQGEETAVNDSNAAIGQKEEISCQEADDNAAVDAEEGIVPGSESEYKLLHTKNEPSPNAVLNQEHDLSEGIEGDTLQSRALDLKEVFAMEAPSVPFEPLGVAVTSTVTDDREKEEEVNNVLSRASLQPIAEEPPCDSDSSTDTICLISEREAGSEVKETQQEVLDLSSKDPEEQSNPMLEACFSQSVLCNINAATEPSEDVEAKSLIPEADCLQLDNVANSPVAFVSMLETPSVPESAVEKLESVPVGVLPTSSPEAGVVTGAILNGEMDLSLQFELMRNGDASPEALGSEPITEKLEMKTEDEVDFLKDPSAHAVSEETINRESWCSIEPCSDPSLLEPTQAHESRECENFLEDGLSGDCASSQSVLKGETGSESEFFSLPGDGMDDIIFGKPEEEQSTCDITSSSSSADDTMSLERNSSLGSDISLPQALNFNRPKERHTLDGSCINMAAGGGQESELGGSCEMEEEMDSITEVPPHSSVLRNSMRPLSPFRRHSWGPGKNAANEAEMNHRSSMRVLGDGIRKPPIHRRSLSWCPSGVQYITMGADFNCRSYSLEGLAGDSNDNKKPSSNLETSSLSCKDLRPSPLASDDRGSLVSLTEEEVESEQGESRGFDRQIRQRSQPHGFSFCASPTSSPLTKSISLMTIIQPGLDTQRRTRPSRRISFSFNISPLIPKSKTLFSIGSSSSDEEEELNSTRLFNSTSSSLSQSVSEESGNVLPPSPSRKDLEGKSGTKVSRTFSYLRNKMSSSKKSKEKEKDKEKTKEKDKDSKEKEKDKKMLNGHLFSPTPTVGPISCYHCMKPFNKDSHLCANCNAIVHKGCKESLASCAKVKMKQQKGMLQAHDTSSLPTVIMRSKTSQPKERPRSAILAPDESTITSVLNHRRSQQSTTLSKSVSIQNIAGVVDENIIHTWKFLSQSTDSLHKISRVNESTESLTDEGADMNEGQLMGDFEMDSKQLEAESWSQVVDSKFLQQQKENVVKRQDVLYELMQTEMHHVRTLKIMSDVYSRGMMQELQFEQQMVEKVFPCLDDLLNIHSQFYQRILERKKESLVNKSEKNFVIRRIGDILVNQFSGENGERMKKTYGKFCGHHNEAVNYFKDLQSKEKRFQAFIKKKMSSAVVRRLGIPECILLVTQRITKYPVLLQRILQYTKENEVEHQDLTQSLNLVKDVIAAVNSKVSNYEKKTRLSEIYTRTDSKSIMRMKSGQMFAREDLRRRKLIRDGPVSLKNTAGRLKEVLAVLLSDTLVFLQEKDQKYVFASLDQRSTVISLKKLIVREVAHEEKGLFLITTVVKDPEMVEIERNSWIQIIQDTINTMDKDEDEGIPSESELEKRVLDTKARELKEQLQQKDQQILALLEEKEKIFRDMTDCSMQEDSSVSRVLFRSNTEGVQKGMTVMKHAINEVEYLQSLISRNLGSALVAADLLPNSEQEGGVGPISLPRRAETFGGFDSHQMNASKCGEKDEGDDAQDLRRTESDSILKKGGNANLMYVLKRNSEQVLESITYLHSLLSTLQAVVLQQDTYIEDQKVMLSERALMRSSSRPNSLIEQEKQRSLEKQRQELANLQKQQAQHQEEKRRREKEWEAREKELTERETGLGQREEQAQKGHQELEKGREELKLKKEAYQLDLERLRTAQKQLEKEKEQFKREVERLPPVQMEPDLRQASNLPDKTVRIPSLPTAEDSKQHSFSLSKQGHLDAGLSVSPKRNSLSRTHKEKGTFHLLSTTNQTNKAAEGQQPARLFSLAKPKEKKEKKKKGKGQRSQPADAHSSEAPPEGEEIFC
nr:A-kinase anchor protein 13 isoform X3 [Pelodiscus sinensis]|eukprot:XP_025037471.1 A-kinase anchor protein 13 isoform X3 [Pelodiscus sinensis]